MKSIIAGLILMVSSGPTWADELNDMPDLACARASSDLEREQLGCREPYLARVRTRGDASPRDTSPQAVSPLDRSEDD